jgi:WhiB family transcriptional regulator, redox-sensing transcriptional regulator
MTNTLIGAMDAGLVAQSLEAAAPAFALEQAEPSDRVTLKSTLTAGRHGPASTPNGWVALAKSKTMEPALFFPHDGVGVRLAQQICAICPVKRACLAYALDNRLNHGVWGGPSERERRRILR